MNWPGFQANLFRFCSIFKETFVCHPPFQFSWFCFLGRLFFVIHSWITSKRLTWSVYICAYTVSTYVSMILQYTGYIVADKIFRSNFQFNSWSLGIILGMARTKATNYMIRCSKFLSNACFFVQWLSTVPVVLENQLKLVLQLSNVCSPTTFRAAERFSDLRAWTSGFVGLSFVLTES